MHCKIFPSLIPIFHVDFLSTMTRNSRKKCIANSILKIGTCIVRMSIWHPITNQKASFEIAKKLCQVYFLNIVSWIDRDNSSAEYIKTIFLKNQYESIPKDILIIQPVHTFRAFCENISSWFYGCLEHKAILISKYFHKIRISNFKNICL